MALRTTITDKDSDQPRKLPHGWGWWHVERMAEVIRAEVPEAKDALILDALAHCPHVVQTEHVFTDPLDDEVLVLSPGDVLDAWRDR